jgi:hypothetical protein
LAAGTAVVELLQENKPMAAIASKDETMSFFIS